MIYLASPYTHPEELIRARRYIAAREFVFDALQRGYPVVSPIVYCHQFARDFGAPVDAKSWFHLNKVLLDKAETLWVLKLQGWDESTGVIMEIEYALQRGLTVSYREPLAHANF